MAHIPADKILPGDFVIIYDHGPPEPESPELPEVSGLDPASIEHRDAHNERNRLIEQYRARKAEWDQWQKDPRPRAMRMHAIDARDAMDKEPERYLLEPRSPEPTTEPAPHDPPLDPVRIQPGTPLVTAQEMRAHRIEPPEPEDDGPEEYWPTPPPPEDGPEDYATPPRGKPEDDA